MTTTPGNPRPNEGAPNGSDQPYLYSGGRVNDPFGADPFGSTGGNWYDDDPSDTAPGDPFGGARDPFAARQSQPDETLTTGDANLGWIENSKSKGGLRDKLPLLSVLFGGLIFAAGVYLLFFANSGDDETAPTTTVEVSTTQATSSTTSSTTTTTLPPFTPGSEQEVATSFSTKYLSFKGSESEDVWRASFEGYVTPDLKARIEANYSGWITEEVKSRSASANITSIKPDGTTAGVYLVGADVYRKNAQGSLPIETRVLRVVLAQVAGSWKVADVTDVKS